MDAWCIQSCIATKFVIPNMAETKDFSKIDGGEGGIRTHGRLAPTTVFETVPIGHSGTSPGAGDWPVRRRVIGMRLGGGNCA